MRPPKSLDIITDDPQELLDNQAASRLAGAFSTMHLRQGETLAAEGDTVDRCFLIEYGSVEVRLLVLAKMIALMLLSIQRDGELSCVSITSRHNRTKTCSLINHCACPRFTMFCRLILYREAVAQYPPLSYQEMGLALKIFCRRQKIGALRHSAARCRVLSRVFL